MLILPEHENDLLMEYPNYWDSYETTIDLQITLLGQINKGNYQLLEQISQYYSPLSKLLFDKLYCADYHHIYRAVVCGEKNTMNQQVINEFFKINFSDENYSYEDLLEKIKNDINNAVKQYTYNLSLDEIKAHAHGFIDQYISSFDERYWLQLSDIPHELSHSTYDKNNFIRFRRAKQLEEILSPNKEEISFFMRTQEVQHYLYIECLYGLAGEQLHTTNFINISRDQFFNKKI